MGTAGHGIGVAVDVNYRLDAGIGCEDVFPALSITVHYEGVAVKIIGVITTPAIECIVTAHAVLVHLVGIAVERIIAVTAVETVVPAMGLTVHDGNIAVEDIVASKAVDRLPRPLKCAIFNVVAIQGVVT